MLIDCKRGRIITQAVRDRLEACCQVPTEDAAFQRMVLGDAPSLDAAVLCVRIVARLASAANKVTTEEKEDWESDDDE